MPLIIPANTLSTGGFDVANSCRFNAPDDAYMHKTPGSSGSRRIGTFSIWVKLALNTPEGQYLFSGSPDATTTTSLGLSIDGDDLRFNGWTSNVEHMLLVTDRKFRDASAFYNIVVAWDTTQGTASNRVKIYVNGVQETSFSTETYPDENRDLNINNASNKTLIGARSSANYAFGDGYYSEVVMIDGTQLDATSFGEFDEDSGIWKPIDVSGLTFGTNGFYLDFEDSSNLGNDANGGTDLTEVNLAAIDQTTDTPTNNFATLNALDNFYFGGTLTEGNVKVLSDAAVESYITSTIAVDTGKWYWEIKITASGSGRDFVGIGDRVSTATDFSPYSGNSNMVSYYGYNGDSKAGSTSTNSPYGATFTTGDIIGVAMDLDNNKLYFSKNGTFQNSGDPTSGATGTGALAIPTTPRDGVWYAQFANIHNTASTFEANFGNPSFSISSGNADGNSRGNFEYLPPSGYLSLCTKNLSEVLS